MVINVYSPRVDPESCERLPYKLNFFTALRERCRELEQSGRCAILLVGIVKDHLKVGNWSVTNLKMDVAFGYYPLYGWNVRLFLELLSINKVNK